MYLQDIYQYLDRIKVLPKRMYINPAPIKVKHFNMNNGDQPLQQKRVDENMDDNDVSEIGHHYLAKQVYVSQKPKISIPNLMHLSRPKKPSEQF